MKLLGILCATQLLLHGTCGQIISHHHNSLRIRRELFSRISGAAPPPTRRPTTSQPPPPPTSEPPAACPIPSNGICTREYAPVLCGPNACEYSNRCIANLAGFDEEECESARPPVCPLPDSSTPCILIYQPVVCGPNDCPYDNQCFADAAGFSDADCEETTPPDPTCPVPTGNVPCPAVFMPVVCGPEGCEYSNMCIARQAGFANSDCDTRDN